MIKRYGDYVTHTEHLAEMQRARELLSRAMEQMEYKLSHTQTQEGRRNVCRVMDDVREFLEGK